MIKNLLTALNEFCNKFNLLYSHVNFLYSVIQCTGSVIAFLLCICLWKVPRESSRVVNTCISKWQAHIFFLKGQGESDRLSDEQSSSHEDGGTDYVDSDRSDIEEFLKY